MIPSFNRADIALKVFEKVFIGADPFKMYTKRIMLETPRVKMEQQGVKGNFFHSEVIEVGKEAFLFFWWSWSKSL